MEHDLQSFIQDHSQKVSYKLAKCNPFYNWKWLLYKWLSDSCSLDYPQPSAFCYLVDVSGNNNYRYTTTNDFSFGMPYDITIQQTQDLTGYWYGIIINGSTVLKVQNTQPKIFSNVKEYLSDPWYPAFTSDFGYVSNLKICNLNICM